MVTILWYTFLVFIIAILLNFIFLIGFGILLVISEYKEDRKLYKEQKEERIKKKLLKTILYEKIPFN